MDQAIILLADDYPINKDKLAFVDNSDFKKLINIRSKNNPDEILSLYYISILNYIINPIANFNDQIFFGSEVNALDINTLLDLNISVIINCAGTHSCEFYKSKFKYLSFEIDDKDDFILPINEIVTTISHYVKLGHKILVHCIEGKSRSGAAILAYFMSINKWTYRQALDYVSTQRKPIPNNGFVRQLKNMHMNLDAKDVEC
jgi:hypothetical protein